MSPPASETATPEATPGDIWAAARSTGLGLPYAPIAAPAVAGLLAEHHGLRGHLDPIATEKDDTFLLTTTGRRHLVKVASPHEKPADVDLQNQAMLHAAVSAGLPVQQPLAGTDGHLVHRVPTPDGDRLLRVLTYLPGRLLADEEPTECQAASLGRVGGRLTRSLESFAHPAQDRLLIWDLRRFTLVGPWLEDLGEDDEDSGETAAEVAARFGDTVLPVLDQLPHQVVHSDLSPHNVLVDPARDDYACGIIDFGDVVRTARVFDVAVGMSNLLSTDPADPWAKAVAFARGYSSTRPLTEPEVSVLAVASLARVVLRMVVARWRASTEPARRAYLLSHSARDAEHLRLAHRAGVAAVTERLHDLVATDHQGERS